LERIILDSKAETNNAIGVHPDSRSVEQRLASGFILLDKPAGPTSHQVASWVRDLFGLERLGHGGTLDPFATGVLPLLAGKSMKVTKKVLTHDKTYIAIFRCANEPDEKELQSAMRRLTGRVYNVPPEISAVKVQVRTRTISNFEMIERNGKDILTRVDCESGTYIRTMARDLGLILGYKVELKELRREKSGRFELSKCVTLQEVADAYWLWKECDSPDALLKMIHPVEKLVLDMPAAHVKDSAAAAIAHGAPLLRPGIVEVDGGISSGKEIAIFTLKDELVGIVKLTVDSNELPNMDSGEVARPSMVLLEQDLYPRRWSVQDK
jgi:H/ACA ribonucleoprotein complex subunit 4